MKRFLSKSAVLAVIAGVTASHAGVTFEQMVIAVCIMSVFGLSFEEISKKIEEVNKKLEEISSKLDGKEKSTDGEESEEK